MVQATAVVTPGGSRRESRGGHPPSLQKPLKPEDVVAAPFIWQAAMEKAVIPVEARIRELTAAEKRAVARKSGGQPLTKKDRLQAIVDQACKTSGSNDPDDEGEFVSVSPDGYIIYKLKRTGAYGVAGVAPIYKIKRIGPSESMRAQRAGRGLCMCRAMGTCPLMAYTHPPPCSLCTDPVIMRYYPTDSNWWDLRDQVKEFRKLANFEDEVI